jgi:hypothetical protein
MKRFAKRSDTVLADLCTAGRAEHFIVTRFNVPDHTGAARWTEAWLIDRVPIWQRITLPSLTRQTSKAFRYLILIDDRSPDFLVETLQQATAEASFAVNVVRVRSFDAHVLRDVMSGTLATAASRITTRLDNDDALATNFVERLQSLPVPAAPLAVNFVHGMQCDAARIYTRADRSNPFISVVTVDGDHHLNAYAGQHHLLAEHVRVKQVRGEHAWLQTLHSANLGNRAVTPGIRPSARAYELFPDLPPQVRVRHPGMAKATTAAVNVAREVRQASAMLARRRKRVINARVEHP